MSVEKAFWSTLIVLLAMGTILPSAAFCETVGWVTGFSGEATVERAEMGVLRVSVGLGIEEGDVLLTGSDGRMKVLFVDDTILSMGSETRISLTEYQYSPHNKIRRSLFDLVKGKVRLLVGKLFGVETNAKVRTPTAVAGVTGTTFFVEYDPIRKETRILTLHGVVRASSTDVRLEGEFPVAEGEISTVLENMRPTEPRLASAEEIAFYQEATFVRDEIELSKIPGRSGNMVDNPTAGIDEKRLSSSYAKSISARAEGEGGAEFDAYFIPENEGKLPDTDLPLDNRQDDVGVGDLIEKPELDAHAVVGIGLSDDPEDNDEK